MAQKFSLKNAEQVRLSQTALNQQRIKTFYEDLAKEVAREIKKRGKKDITQSQLILLQRDIKTRLKEISEDIQNGIVDSMKTTANAVVVDTRTFLKQCGFREEDTLNAFLYVPDNVVQNIVNGNVYQEGWSLSQAIWGHTQNFNQKLTEIVGKGAQSYKSAYEIAKDLEQYVNPTEAKESRRIVSWRKARQTDVDAGRAKVVGEKIKDSYYMGRVDYNAQRLARTMISHAYQQSFVTVNEKDPFVTGYRWITSNFHGRVCEICRERSDTDKFGLGVGVFPKDQLPLDHPNGMCTFEAVIPDSMTSIAEKIGKWYEAPTGTYPDIDEYSMQF